MNTLNRALGILAILISFAYVIFWALTDSGPYRWFGLWIGTRWDNLSIVGTWLATLMVPLFISLVIVGLFRHLAGLPGIIGTTDEFKRTFYAEHSQNEALYRTPTHAYTPEMRRRARWLGVTFFFTGLAMGGAGITSLLAGLDAGAIYMYQISLIVMGSTLVVAGLYQIVAGRSFLRG